VDFTASKMGPGSNYALRHVEWDYEAVAAKNQQNLKNSKDGAVLTVLARGTLVLIGPDHDPGFIEIMEDERATNSGTVKVKKGGAFDPGSLTFFGIADGRDELKTHLADFSKKKVIFG
jgi:hypothetical protein